MTWPGVPVEASQVAPVGGHADEGARSAAAADDGEDGGHAARGGDERALFRVLDGDGELRDVDVRGRVDLGDRGGERITFAAGVDGHGLERDLAVGRRGRGHDRLVGHALADQRAKLNSSRAAATPAMRTSRMARPSS